MTSTDRRRFSALSQPECLSRLTSGTIGRVAWNTVNGPQVLPVTYTLHEGKVVFRTDPAGPLAELQDHRSVAFEVDEFDPRMRTGWSVVVRGHSSAARHPDEMSQLWREADPVPWAGGGRKLFILISADSVTGRSVWRDSRDED